MCDYLNLAISSVPKNKVEGEGADKVKKSLVTDRSTLVSLYQGVVMTQKELEKALAAQGIKKVVSFLAVDR